MFTGYSIGLEEQLILRIDQELRNQLDDIITKMQTLAHKFDIKRVKERSPFKNVLTVATDPTSSLEVIKNYIRYQAGRKEASKVWKLEETENGKKQVFADAVVQQINDLSENFQKIFDSINDSLEEEMQFLKEETKNRGNQEFFKKQENLELLKNHLQANKQRLKQSIHLNLAQLYLGYLSREHTALVGYGKDDKEQTSNQQPKNK